MPLSYWPSSRLRNFSLKAVLQFRRPAWRTAWHRPSCRAGGVPLHQPQVVIEVGRGEQRFVGDPGRIFGVNQLGILRRHAPVAVGVAGDDAVL